MSLKLFLVAASLAAVGNLETDALDNFPIFNPTIDTANASTHIFFRSFNAMQGENFIVNFYTLPNSLRGPPYNVSLTLNTTAVGRAVQALVSATTVLSVANPGYTQLSFPVPPNVQPETNAPIEVQSGSWIRRSSSILPVSFEAPKQEFIFIQTDKKFYAPGQEVHFRVLVLNSALMGVSKNIWVTVVDGSGSTLHTWNVLDRMFVTKSFYLNDNFNLGLVTIFVTAQSIQEKFQPGFLLEYKSFLVTTLGESLTNISSFIAPDCSGAVNGTRSRYSISLELTNDQVDTELQDGETYNFVATTTAPVTEIWFLVTFRGKQLKQGKITGSQNFDFSYQIPQDFTGTIEFLVWFLETESNEIVSAVISKKVKTQRITTTQITARWLKSDIRPGEKNTIIIETTPNTQISIFAFDKRGLANAGNAMTFDEVESTIWQLSSRPRWIRNYGAEVCGGNAFADFFTANLALGSDAYLGTPAFWFPGMQLENFNTWIWTEGSTNSEGQYEKEFVAADEISDWVLHAFAMSATTKLAVLQEPAQFRTSQLFYGRLHIPMTVVTHGEAIRVSCELFNFQQKDVNVQFKMENSEAYVASRNGDEYMNGFVYPFRVAANKSEIAYFWLKPLVVGDIEVVATASTEGHTHTIKKKLKVEFAGVEQYANYARYATATDGPIEFRVKPDKSGVVSGSVTLELSVIGTPMGSATNLGDKIRLPTGCGEQTLITLCPNVYILQYLEAKTAITTELREKALRFIESGYQNELRYLRNDGGYSAFGNSDQASSTWLTAFALRCFKQAEKAGYLSPDAAIMQRSYSYLSATPGPQQVYSSTDGIFEEFGRVLHTSMKGGSESHKTRSAYLYLMAVENGIVARFPDVKAKMIAIAEMTGTTLFTHAVLAYAFSLDATTSGDSNAIITKLMSSPKKVENDDMLYWDPQANGRYGGPGAIEVTSYILLAQIENGAEVSDTLPIAKWLMTKRNSLGGWQSTQDTVVGLHALSEFAKTINENPDLDIKFEVFKDTDLLLTETFELTTANGLVQQIEYVSPAVSNDATTVKITLTGTGKALVQTAVTFYTLEPEVNDVVIQHDGARPRRSTETDEDGNIWVTGCAKGEPGAETVGMTIIQVGIPSGYTVDKAQTKLRTTAADIKLIEFTEKKVFAYIDELSSVETCVLVKMLGESGVQNIQPVPVIVYPYYEPEEKKVSMLALPAPDPVVIAPPPPTVTEPPPVMTTKPAGVQLLVSSVVLQLLALAYF